MLCCAVLFLQFKSMLSTGIGEEDGPWEEEKGFTTGTGEETLHVSPLPVPLVPMWAQVTMRN